MTIMNKHFQGTESRCRILLYYENPDSELVLSNLYYKSYKSLLQILTITISLKSVTDVKLLHIELELNKYLKWINFRVTNNSRGFEFA